MNQKKKMPEGKYVGTAKVGTKGQIVIPKEIRDLFGIEPGETLLLLADIERGIAVMKADVFDDILDVLHKVQQKSD
ncbi:AbrB/MazE/SpoVT family DNA-binding domain-containing protein [Thermoactinomyces mirandus]|uniref:AbrB/MazE/SpoVT family DNA-binding domain-containing protein n=1 Tax=Thermoactinomyces mirandus TaxID=2756294 RepID=A0A7W1XTN6_9BACL|nr:AbrB/MazE/SpoVT family DNA-binding domain-containing protein [Thermoactinomyces mirandus]MBA4603093.1 AbrB/MazE/SpoVT family DNA-binding domain-containing protein [Thermoactinomyces mirandus]